MTHLCTETVTPAVFTRQDFDDAVALLKRVQHKEEGADKDLAQWVLSWKHTILACEEDTPFFIALTTIDGILFSPPERGADAVEMSWRPDAPLQPDAPLLWVGLSVLVNLSQCTTFDEVAAIIHYFREDVGPQNYGYLGRPTAVQCWQEYQQRLLTTVERVLHG